MYEFLIVVLLTINNVIHGNDYRDLPDLFTVSIMSCCKSPKTKIYRLMFFLSYYYSSSPLYNNFKKRIMTKRRLFEKRCRFLTFFQALLIIRFDAKWNFSFFITIFTIKTKTTSPMFWSEFIYLPEMKNFIPKIYFVSRIVFLETKSFHFQ